MNNKKKRVLISLVAILLLVGIFFSTFSTLIVSVTRAESLYTSAVGSCVIEGSTGRVLFEKNKDKKLAMASTTKIMTAITAIENCEDLDEKFEIPPKAVGIEGTSLYLRKGDVYSTRDLLYALMLISGNDASVAIAEHVAGTTSEFVTLMNEKAKEIGATNSHFANTHGLDEDGHYTTAYDLAKITAYALNNDTFREIVSTQSTKIVNSKEGQEEPRYLRNKNKLLFKLDGCIGVKTGFTNDAGRCLVSAIERNGMRLICVVLNCGPMFVESATLLNSCASIYSLVDVTSLYDYKRKVKVLDGRKKESLIGTRESFIYPLSEYEKNNLKFEYNLPEALQAPLKKGEEVGEIKVFLNNNLLFSEKVYTIEEIKPKTILQRLKEFAGNW